MKIELKNFKFISFFYKKEIHDYNLLDKFSSNLLLLKKCLDTIIMR